MPFNGSGTYNPPSAPTFPAIPNTTIESTKYNNVVQDLATALSNCMTRDGQSPCTANIPLAGFLINNLGTGVLDTDAANLGQVMVLRGAIGASDWNNLIKTGIYEASAASLTGPAANFPPTSETGQLLVGAQGNVIVHLYITASLLLTRNKVGAVWSGWSKSFKSISSNTTIAIPGDFATLALAMDYLGDFQIEPGVTVTIDFADGTHDTTSVTTLNHPQGERINIVGNTATPANCVIRWNGTPNNDMWRITGNNVIGSINGFTFTCVTPGAAGLAAIKLEDSASCTLGANNVFNTWTYMVELENKSFIDILGGTFTGTDGNTRGLVVSGPCFANVANVTMTNGALGIVLDFGATVSLNACTITSMTNNGISAIRDSRVILFLNNAISSCTQSGISLDRGSQVFSSSTTNSSNSNTQFGINWNANMKQSLVTMTLTGNGSGAESTTLGSNTNVLVSTVGDLELSPAAGSNVRFGTRTASADVPVTGYIEIKDSGGTIRRLAVVG